MKFVIFITLSVLSHSAFSQTTTQFPTNMLFRQATEFGYEGSYPFWMVKKTAIDSCSTNIELWGFTSKGEHEFTLKLNSAKYCQVCDEMECSYNGIMFILRQRITNNEISWMD